MLETKIITNFYALQILNKNKNPIIKIEERPNSFHVNLYYTITVWSMDIKPDLPIRLHNL